MEAATFSFGLFTTANGLRVLLGIFVGVGTFVKASVIEGLISQEPAIGELHSYFCSGSLGQPPSPCQSDKSCSLYRQLCSDRNTSRFCLDDSERGQQERCCATSQMFVCEYKDIVVCSDDLGTCAYAKDKSFCTCKTKEALIKESCEEPILTAVVILGCVVVVLIILSVILSYCVCRKRCQARSRTDALKAVDIDSKDDVPCSSEVAAQHPPSVPAPQVAGPLQAGLRDVQIQLANSPFFKGPAENVAFTYNVYHQSPAPDAKSGVQLHVSEQRESDPQEYSHAYSQTPVTDPGGMGCGPDLDEQQADHYSKHFFRI